MEHWLLDRRRPVAADAAELLAAARTVTGRLKSPDSRGRALLAKAVAGAITSSVSQGATS